MNTLDKELEEHYFRPNLYEDILDRLRNQGTSLTNVSRTDIAGVDEIHVRGAKVSMELAESVDLHGATVLDVGCGLGGPCRLLADEYACITTGIDLSGEYIRTATLLSELVNLADKTTFVQGNATELPFDDESFHVVWTQHVQMNIPDKEKFYAEMFRVLKPGGHLLYYDIFRSAGGNEVTYPMPWATDSSQSFLAGIPAFETIMTDLGFQQIQVTDQTGAGIRYYENLMAKMKDNGPPNLGLNVLMGETTGPKLMNLLKHMQSDQLTLQSGVYRKA